MCILLLKNAYPSQTAHSRAQGQHLTKECQNIKCTQNLILGGVYVMQKWQIPNFLFDPHWSSMFGVPQCIRVTSDQAAHKTIYSQNAFLGGVYFMQKCKICKFVFDTFHTRQFWGARLPQGDLRLKKFTRAKSS